MADILYVEDDYINALVVTKFLEHQHRISVARDPQDALNLIEQQAFDLVMLDICLGNNDQDGTWLLHEIRKKPEYFSKKIVAITAHATEDKEKYLSMGFDSYLSKPIGREDLIFHLDRLLLD